MITGTSSVHKPDTNSDPAEFVMLESFDEVFAADAVTRLKG
jgi:hypothetical protein